MASQKKATVLPLHKRIATGGKPSGHPKPKVK